MQRYRGNNVSRRIAGKTLARCTFNEFAKEFFRLFIPRYCYGLGRDRLEITEREFHSLAEIVKRKRKVSTYRSKVKQTFVACKILTFRSIVRSAVQTKNVRCITD